MYFNNRIMMTTPKILLRQFNKVEHKEYSELNESKPNSKFWIGKR